MTELELSLDSQEGYFEYLRQMVVFGEVKVNRHDRTITRREDEHPWHFLEGSRRSGKTAWAQWVDEHVAMAAADRHAVVREVAQRALGSAQVDDTPVTVRWSCLKPTDPPTRVLYEGEYAVVKQGVIPGSGDFLQMWLERR